MPRRDRANTCLPLVLLAMSTARIESTSMLIPGVLWGESIYYSIGFDQSLLKFDDESQEQISNCITNLPQPGRVNHTIAEPLALASLPEGLTYGYE